MSKAVEVVQVIRTTLETRGDGTKEKPFRYVTQYWTLEGDLLWEFDPLVVREECFEASKPVEG
jgi:hypothetical protein